MELVEGPTLAERISHGQLPLEEALPIGRQMAEALEYAHVRGIVHRDLKPANIKVTPEGRVKVLDFGLAKALSNEPAATDRVNSRTLTRRATQMGVILGTAAYMAPEQAKGKPVDRRADIWAFGVVVWEMLTGRALFGGETVSDTLAAVLKTDPDWRALPPSTPASVRRLLRRCLERDCMNRLRNIGDTLADLDERQDRADPPLAVPPEPQRHWWIAIAAVLALIAVGEAVALYRGTLSGYNSTLRLHIDPPEGGQFVLGIGLTAGGFAISPDTDLDRYAGSVEGQRQPRRRAGLQRRERLVVQICPLHDEQRPRCNTVVRESLRDIAVVVLDRRNGRGTAAAGGCGSVRRELKRD
jgi:serine/threonine-protein kinase